jgi:hypothetical protein
MNRFERLERRARNSLFICTGLWIALPFTLWALYVRAVPLVVLGFGLLFLAIFASSIVFVVAHFLWKKPWKNPWPLSLLNDHPSGSTNGHSEGEIRPPL